MISTRIVITNCHEKLIKFLDHFKRIPGVGIPVTDQVKCPVVLELFVNVIRKYQKSYKNNIKKFYIYFWKFLKIFDRFQAQVLLLKNQELIEKEWIKDHHHFYGGFDFDKCRKRKRAQEHEFNIF